MTRVRAQVLLASSSRPLQATELSARERAQCGRAHRPLEWLTSRRALRLLLTVLGLPRDTSRYVFPHPRLSLSHTARRSIAAAAIRAPGGIGVDLETPRRTDPRTARFFLSADEQRWLSATCSSVRNAELLRLWTVKEALYKADPANHATALRDYTLDHPAAASGHARRPDGAWSAYTTTRLDGACLAVAAGHAAFTRELTTMPAIPSLTLDAVAARIASLTSLPVADLTADTALAAFADDSLVLVEIVVDLQEEFDVTLTQADLRPARTLGDLVALLRGEHRAATD